MKFCCFFVPLSVFIGCASAMDKIDVSSILQPSDLFGKEILPECTFESEYGKLKFNAVVVPDFSKDKVELELLTKQFDDIKALMKEDDLLKKRTIAARLFVESRRFIPSIDKDEVVPMGNFVTNCQLRQMNFRNLLRVSILCRLFETGVSMRYGICLEFGFDPFDSDTREKFLNALMSYNDNAIIQPLACTTGVYIQSLGKCLIPEAVCNHDFPDTLTKIKKYGVPQNNSLSWAFFSASSDQTLTFLRRCCTIKVHMVFVYGESK